MILEGINTGRRQHRPLLPMGYDYAVDVTRLQGPSASCHLGMCTLAWAGLQEGESVGGTCSYCSGPHTRKQASCSPNITHSSPTHL